MARFWTSYWQFRTWRDDINTEYVPVRSSGSNQFRKRGVSVGDIVYVISLGAGQLYLGGRMTVKGIVSRLEAVRLYNDAEESYSDNLYDANEWIVDPDKAGTLLHLHRRLAPALAKQLQFESKAGPKAPRFVSETRLDSQTTRGVRELTAKSAALLDRIIQVTDRLPHSGQIVTVSEGMLRGQPPPNLEEFQFPDEVPSGAVFNEGSVRRVAVNRYERDTQARLECIAAHGTSCCVCRFSFAREYGPQADGYIHVHHLTPLSEVGEKYQVDPVADLRPVCPNCHAVIHLGGQLRTIEEVRLLLATRKRRGRRKRA